MRTTSPATPDAAVSLHRHPGVFYGLSLAIPWTLWLVAGWLSRRPDAGESVLWAATILALVGLLAPMVVALVLSSRDPRLSRDVRGRLGLRGLTPRYLMIAIGLLPGALLVATAISLPLGYPADQFLLKGTSSAMVGMMPGWLTIGLAPVVEELAWHTYGTDCLAARWTVWRTTIVFAVFWALWHVPLATIKGSYQAEVADVGPLASANFLLSVFPLMILMNWLYFRSHRNVWVAVLLHLSANYGNELLQTSPDTKVIQTAVLLVPCAWVLWHDRALFFTRPTRS